MTNKKSNLRNSSEIGTHRTNSVTVDAAAFDSYQEQNTSFQTNLNGAHTFYNTAIMSRWNQSFTDKFSTKENEKETFNKGTSFFVAPNNFSFNKRALNAVNKNRDEVIGDLQTILTKHEEAEAKAMRGMSPEMIALKKNNKPAEIVRTEQLLSKISQN